MPVFIILGSFQLWCASAHSIGALQVKADAFITTPQFILRLFIFLKQIAPVYAHYKVVD